MYYAEKNNGAYLNNQRIRVSNKKNIDSCLFAIGGSSIEEIKFKNNITIRRSGSAALDMAYVAAGKFDGCLQKNIKIWDIAAGLILVKEAGGIINNIDINKHEYEKVIASSVEINEKLIKNLINF